MQRSTDVLRVALVGAGRFGAKRAAAVAKSGRSRLVLIADSNLEAARDLACKYAAAATSDWTQAATRDDVDAVIVSTPTHRLAEVSLLAAQTCKHVLAEKPFGRNPEEVFAVVEAAREAGVALKAGYYQDEWRANTGLSGGGQLLDQGVHALDLFRWFLGDFEEVSAMVSTLFWPIAPAEDNVFATLRAGCGAVAQLHASWTFWKNKFSFTVIGEKGYLCVDGLGGSYGPERLCLGLRENPGDVPNEKWSEFPGPDNSLELEWEDFLDSIIDGRELMSGGEDAWRTLRLVQSIYQAANERRTLRVEQTVRPSHAVPDQCSLTW